MKTKLFLLLTCICYVNIYGQYVGFDNHMITDNANEVWAVFPADTNGDGDIDVFSASAGDNTIACWENDGSGNFTEHEISTTAGGVSSLFAAYIDGDVDIDVISGSFGDDTISWWENDGSGNFTEYEITIIADGVSSVFAADIDGDGDMDVIATSFFDSKVAWYNNLNGDGTLWDEQIITTNAIGARSVYAADLDDDGDMDVLSASQNDGIIAWYENTDGLGSYGPQQIIIEDPIGAWRISVGDLNGDGFFDVIANVGSSTTVWCENDGFGIFDVHPISSNSVSEWLYSYDIDEDGDEDVISAEFAASKLGYYENTDGQGGNFEARWLVTVPGWVQPRSVHVADIDDDGDLDLISGWWGSDHIGWHENIGLGVDDNMLSDFSVYPNPTTGILNVQSKTAIIQIEIHNLLGQLVLSNTNQNTIDISSVSQGVYYIKVMDENGDFGTQKVVKN